MVTADTDKTTGPPPPAVVTPNTRPKKVVLSAWAPPVPPPPLFSGPQALQDLAGLDQFLLFPEEPSQVVTTVNNNYCCHDDNNHHHDQDHSSSSSLFRMTSSLAPPCKRDLFPARHEEDSVVTTSSNNMKNGNWWVVVQSLQRAIAAARIHGGNSNQNNSYEDFLDVAELLCTGYQSERQTVWALRMRIHELEDDPERRFRCDSGDDHDPFGSDHNGGGTRATNDPVVSVDYHPNGFSLWLWRLLLKDTKRMVFAFWGNVVLKNMAH
jgi:hypothetical protein